MLSKVFFKNGGQRVYANRVAASVGNYKSMRGRQGKREGEVFVTDEDIVGEDSADPCKRTGLFAFTNFDDIKIIAIPNGTTRKIQNAMIAHCEQMKNRFAVLDSKKRRYGRRD
jgi:hypothetical protein